MSKARWRRVVPQYGRSEMRRRHKNIANLHEGKVELSDGNGNSGHNTDGRDMGWSNEA